MLLDNKLFRQIRSYWAELFHPITFYWPKPSRIRPGLYQDSTRTLMEPLLYMRLDTTTNFSWIFDDLGVPQAK